MERNEFQVMIDEVHQLISEGHTAQAQRTLDGVAWGKLHNVNALIKGAELYEQLDRPEDARELLMVAHDRSPIGRMAIYHLAMVCLKLGEIKEAREYYDDFVEIAPRDSLRFVIRYRISEAEGAPLERRIAILEEQKDEDFLEDWALELAALYEEAGRVDDCANLCDEIIVWFGEGPYVEKALEMKRRYRPLDRDQEQKLRRLQREQTGRDEEAVSDIRIEPISFDTFNLQEEIKKTMDGILAAKTPDKVTENMEHIKELVEEMPYLQPDAAAEQEEVARRRRDSQRFTKAMRDQLEESLKAAEEETDEKTAAKTADTDSEDGQEKKPLPTVEDVMQEWERTKRAAEAALAAVEEEKLEAAKQEALAEATEILGRLEAIIPRLQAGVTHEELIAETNQERSAIVRQREPERDASKAESQGKSRRRARWEAREKARREVAAGEQAARAAAEEQELAALLSSEMQEVISPETPPEDGAKMPDPQEGQPIVSQNEHPKKEASVIEPEPEELRERETPAEAGEDPLLSRPTKIIPSGEIARAAAEEETEEEDGGALIPDSLKAMLLRREEDDKNREAPEGSDAGSSLQEEEVIPREDAAERTADDETPEELSSVPPEEPHGGASDSDEENQVSAEAESAPDDEDSNAADMTEQEAAPPDGEAPEGQDKGQERRLSARERIDARREAERTAEPHVTKRPGSYTQRLPRLFEKVQPLDEEAEAEMLTDEERAFFNYMAPIEGMESQLVHALDGMREGLRGGDPDQRNLIITGKNGSGKSSIASGMIKVLQHEVRLPKGPVGQVDGAQLNEKDIFKIFDRIRGGALIIEHAGTMERATVAALNALVDTDTSGVMIILEDDVEGIESVLGLNPVFTARFRQRVHIPGVTVDELVNFGRAYAEDNGCKIDELGVLALYNHLNLIQRQGAPLSMAVVRNLVEDAITRANQGGLFGVMGRLGTRKRDENGRLLLHEKDFEK